VCFTATSLTLGGAFNALHSASHRWFEIGLQLGVPIFRLNIILRDMHGTMKQLRAVLEYWMNNATDPLPSWKVLVDALKSPTVSESRVAEELEKKYCSPEGQSSLGEWEAI